MLSLLSGIGPFTGPIALDFVAEKLQTQERIEFKDAVLVVLFVLLGPLVTAVGNSQAIRINSMIGIRIRAVFCACVFNKVRTTPLRGALASVAVPMAAC